MGVWVCVLTILIQCPCFRVYGRVSGAADCGHRQTILSSGPSCQSGKVIQTGHVEGWREREVLFMDGGVRELALVHQQVQCTDDATKMHRSGTLLSLKQKVKRVSKATLREISYFFSTEDGRRER